MNKKLMYALMIISAIAIVCFGYIGIHQKARSDNLQNKLENNPPKQHQTKEVSLNRDEIEKYQKLVEKKIDEFKKGDYTDDSVFEDSSAAKVFNGLFTVSGRKGLEENSTKKDYEERYKDFDYELKNVTAQKNVDGDVQLNANVDVKFKGNELNSGYNLFSVNIGKDDKLKGGTLYAEQGAN